MEVHIEDIPRVGLTLVVAGMLPLTTDTGVTKDRTAIHVAEGRTQLATVGDFLDGQAIGRSEREDRCVHFDARLVNEARDQLAAAGDTAGHRLGTVYASPASSTVGADYVAIGV